MKRRRDFLKRIGIGALALPALGHSLDSQGKSIAMRRGAPFYQKKSEKPVRIGLIGAGGMGQHNLTTSSKYEGVSLVAVCDLYKGRVAEVRKKWGQDIFSTQNHRELLDRKDIDAVIVATSDHWHKEITIDALGAGKHVYCEKPMVQKPEQGHEVINAWKKSGKTMMVGSQPMSSLGAEKARMLLEEGAIGELNAVEGVYARRSAMGAWIYDIPEDASEKTVNWKRYVANTTQRSFDSKRFFRWRNYQDYGTGMAGDLFVHLLSFVHFVTQSLGPTKITSLGGLRYWKDGREVPDVMMGVLDYPKTEKHPGFNLSIKCNFIDGSSESPYTRFVGSEGSIEASPNKVVLKKNKPFDLKNDPFALVKSEELSYDEGSKSKKISQESTTFSTTSNYQGDHYDHWGTFLNAIRKGEPVIQDPLYGLRAAGPAILCNHSYEKGTTIQWDPIGMKIKS